jgi:hypothetical protein
MHGHKSFWLLVIIVLFVSCPKEPEDFSGITLDLTAAVSQTDSLVAVDPDFAGMCHAGYSGNLDREYGILDEMGVVWLHRDFSWWIIQPEAKKDAEPSDWNWSGFDSYVQRGNTENKKIMGMLLYGVDWVHDVPGGCGESDSERIICNAAEIAYFCDYAKNTVKRYNGENEHGKVDAWLIWNEPDITRFWTGTPAQFYALNKAVAETIRALDETEDTHTVLISGVFTSTYTDDWITGLFTEGGMLENEVDGVAFHPYGPHPLSCESVFNSFKRKVALYDYADKIWVNEMGYPSYSQKGDIPDGRYGTDQWEGDMPEIVTKTFTLLAAAGTKKLTWYHLFDGANRNNSDSESWFGLVWRKNDNEWIKKGGYWGYAVCANNIPGKTYKQLKFPATVPEDLRTYYFEGSGGGRAFIVWNNHPLTAMDVRIIMGGSNHKLWNLETGESAAIGKTSTYTLQPTRTDQRTPLFITWDE